MDARAQRLRIRRVSRRSCQVPEKQAQTETPTTTLATAIERLDRCQQASRLKGVQERLFAVAEADQLQKIKFSTRIGESRTGALPCLRRSLADGPLANFNAGFAGEILGSVLSKKKISTAVRSHFSFQGGPRGCGSFSGGFGPYFRVPMPEDFSFPGAPAHFAAEKNTHNLENGKDKKEKCQLTSLHVSARRARALLSI